MKRRGPRAARARPVVAVLLAGAAAGACAPAGSGGAAPAGPGTSADLLLPPGHGTLRQDEITLTLRSGELQLKVTPLEEWMIRLTAPDTYDRLSELRAAHRPAIAAETGVSDPELFLVSFFSDEPSVPYEPEDVHLVNGGRRFRPLDIRPVTSGWGTQRLAQRETRMAIYAFDPSVDMDMGLVLEYGDVRNHQWDGILQLLQSEHARVRARTGGGAPGGASAQLSSSRPKRLILR